MGQLIVPYGIPINLVKVKPYQVPQYVSKFMDDWLHQSRLTSKQAGCPPYYQPWRSDDNINFQLQSSSGQIQFSIINCKGQVQGSPYIMQKKQQNKYNPDMFIYEAFLTVDFLPDGVYMLKGLSGAETFISEPFRVEAEHKGTLLFQYKNRSYRGDIIYETGIEMGLRLKGHLKKLVAVSKDTLHEDQVLDMVMVKSQPYRIFQLILEAQPDFMEEIVNWVLGNSDVRIDGRYYTKNEDAKFTRSVSRFYDGLFDFSVDLRESTNRNSKIFDVADANPNDSIVMVLNVDSKGFADTSENASSSVFTIYDVE